MLELVRQHRLPQVSLGPESCHLVGSASHTGWLFFSPIPAQLKVEKAKLGWPSEVPVQPGFRPWPIDPRAVLISFLQQGPWWWWWWWWW